MKADRRWWNDGRLQRELDASRIIHARVVTDDGVLQLHWWEPETIWEIPMMEFKIRIDWKPLRSFLYHVKAV